MTGSPRGGAEVDVDSLVEAARAGQVRAVARLISLVESDSPLLRDVAAALVAHAGHAHVVGLTGPPGVGKSTSTSALVAALRARELTVGVLAVDPSSPFSGGALLGDRIRMQEHATDAGVFIRSMASRGHLGGLSGAVPQALRVLDAAGYDVVLIETVGVGQSEFEIASLADTTVLLLAPGLGDGIQAAKAGILEIADVFVVNKADRDGADQLTRDLRQMQALASPGRSTSSAGSSERPVWRAPIVKTVASRGEGITEVIDAIQGHRAYLAASGEGDGRRARRAGAEIEAIALGQIRGRFAAIGTVHGTAVLAASAARVVAGLTDPYRAADELIALL
jgi:LAO/AO transport system kinase